MEAQKPIQSAAKPAAKKEGSKVGGIKNAFLVIIACFIVAVCLFIFWFGHESHFEEGHPHDIWGTIYMGGVIVPVLQTLFLTVIVLSVERYIALSSAKVKATSQNLSQVLRLVSLKTTSPVRKLSAQNRKAALPTLLLQLSFATRKWIRTPFFQKSRKSLLFRKKLKRLPLWKCLLSSRTSPSWLP